MRKTLNELKIETAKNIGFVVLPADKIQNPSIGFTDVETEIDYTHVLFVLNDLKQLSYDDDNTTIMGIPLYDNARRSTWKSYEKYYIELIVRSFSHGDDKDLINYDNIMEGLLDGNIKSYFISVKPTGYEILKEDLFL